MPYSVSRYDAQACSALIFFLAPGGGGGVGGGGGGGLWSYVHHTVDVKILCSDVVRPSGCPFILVSMPYLMILSK